MAAASLGGPFWRFWGASALANVGDGIRVSAFPLLAAALSDDPVAVAAVAAAQFLPWLVTGVFAGALADRHSTRTMLTAADTARIVVLAILAATVATGTATVTLVVVAAFVLGAGETLRDTAAQTAVPRLVPDRLLERANGRLVAGEIVGNEFVGPPVGAMLFVVGAALPFAVNGAALALAVMLVLSVPLSLRRLPGAAVRGDPGVLAGLTWLLRHSVLRTLAVVVAAVAAADSAWFAIFVLYAQNRLGLGALGFGLLLATGAAGGLVGSLAAERLVARWGHRHVLTWSMAVTAGAPTLLIAVADRAVAVGVVVTSSAAFAVLNVAVLALRQRLVPEGLLGRVIAATRILTYGGTALGALAGGALAAGLGAEAPFMFSGAVAITATLAWYLASARPARGG